jgi:predicted ATPase
MNAVELIRAHLLGLLGERLTEMGHTEEAVSVLAEALALVRERGARFWEAELHRLQGELMLQQSKRAQATQPRSRQKNRESKALRLNDERRRLESAAEKCFQKAIDVARRQAAKSLELRAVMSLSRLWQKQGKEKKARQVLAKIYDWFTEGFDTADLKEARALLEVLSGAAAAR